MKKLIVVMLAVLMVGCANKKIEIIGFSFGDSPSEVKALLDEHGCSVVKDLDDYIKAYGRISAFGYDWDKVTCEFDESKLREINLFSDSYPDANERAMLNRQLEELCGKAQEKPDGDAIVVIYGDKEKMTGYYGEVTYILGDRCYLSVGTKQN